VLNTEKSTLIGLCKKKHRKFIEIPELQNLSFEVIKESTIMKTKYVRQETTNPANRIQKLKESLRVEHMSVEERTAIQDLCKEFADIFHLEGDKISYTNAVHHEIKTSGVTQPIYQKPYRLPYA